MSEEPKTVQKSLHVGSCHCQAIQFTVNVPPLIDSGICDCSYCSKRGIVWGFCEPQDFKMVKGGDKLKDYEFGAKTFKHLWCGHCGTMIGSGSSAESLSKPENTVGYNVRALRDIDIHQIPFVQYSGINRQPPYKTADPIEHKFAESSDGMIVLHGSCHCHNVRFAVQTLPLGTPNKDGTSVTVLDCNCSICAGNGMIWMYPKHENYYFPPEAEEHMSSYCFTEDTPRQNHFYFCKTCGCGIMEKRNISDHIGLNIRLIDGLDLEKAGIVLEDGLSLPPLYSIREELE